ncbi:MAG: GNAT family N-acetyltransferase [Deltaproteobacteria bacterium]|nr:GNAT family N-acetyltransferase [Deltaproteobacteria bacterium]
MPIAYRLLTDRLCLRAYAPDDAPALVDAVRGSREHLRKTMDFADHEPSVPLYREWFAGFHRGFEEANYTFAVWSGDQAVGGCGLHPTVGPCGREAGYWVIESACGRGYATEILHALCWLAFAQERMEYVELRIEPGNTASRRVAEKAGFTHEATLRKRIRYRNQPARDATIYSRFAEAGVQYVPKAFDLNGAPIPAPPS